MKDRYRKLFKEGDFWYFESDNEEANCQNVMFKFDEGITNRSYLVECDNAYMRSTSYNEEEDGEL